MDWMAFRLKASRWVGSQISGHCGKSSAERLHKANCGSIKLRLC